MKLAVTLQLVFAAVAWLAPMSESMEVNLVDTRRETSDLNWETYPSDGGWIEMSNDDENGIPLRTFQVCEIRTPGQNNWFRTDFIPLEEGLENVYVEIKFTIRPCNDLPQVKVCKETFNLYYLEADSRHLGKTQFMNEDVYTKVDTIAARDSFPTGAHVTNTETRKIGPLSSKGLFITFQDTGACMIIFYVRVFYKRCDDVVQNLARFPATITGPERTSLVQTMGKCVPNAVWLDAQPGPNLQCKSDGRWDLPSGSCQCVPGYEPDEDLMNCRGCKTGQYKSTVGNAECKSCPANSLSIKEAAVSCICTPGFYRASTDTSSSPCTRPPSKPEKVEYVVNNTSVELKWSPPNYDGGRKDITYSISCLLCDNSYAVCSECGDGVTYEPDTRFLMKPRVSISNLSPHTNYRFRIYSFNGVSKASRREPLYADARLKTSEAAPTEPKGLKVLERGTSEVTITWSRPSQPNGVIQEYDIQYSNKELNKPRITRSNRTKDLKFQIKYLPPGTFFIVQVRARNAAGFGPFSSPVAFRTLANSEAGFNHVKVPNGNSPDSENNDGTNPNAAPSNGNDQLHLVIGIVLACTLLSIILVSALLIFRIRRKSKKDDQDPEVYPFFNTAGDMIKSQHTTLQRSYIDPSTYSDPDKAVHHFAKEIDSFNIKKEDLMGAGEFGEVYKGLLRPTTPVCDETRNLMSSSQSGHMIVAIKTLKSGYTEKQRQDFLAEATIMGQFDHPNVIRLEGVVTRTTPLMIVTEYMENGSLDTFLEEKHYKGMELEIFQLVHMLRDVADGMKYLSSIGYVHRDLAARNVLVNGDLVCKVSDFGLSRVLPNLQDDGTLIYTTKGGMIPVRWTAPEAITKRTFTSASDVWSFGIVVWEVLTHGERPYWEMPNPDVVHCVENGYRLPPPAFCPRILHNLMLNCWNNDRHRRPTFTQIVTQLDSILMNPEILEDTINNTPVPEQAECIPESLDLSSLGQWLEDMNMAHYKEIMLRYGCVTAEQIIKLTTNQLDEMGIIEPGMQMILLNGADFLKERLAIVNNQGVPV